MRNVLLVFVFLTALPALIRAQENEFTPERLEEFRKLTEQRVTDFQQYLSIIADKKSFPEQKKEAISLATELFIDGAKIQVTGRNNSSKVVPIGAYFNRLSGLASYTKVELTFYDVVSVSKFEKGTDGDYHATATYYQQFKGFDVTGKILYADRTRRDISVNGKTGNKDKDNDDLKIFFGDVVVRETIPINGQ